MTDEQTFQLAQELARLTGRFDQVMDHVATKADIEKLNGKIDHALKQQTRPLLSKGQKAALVTALTAALSALGLYLQSVLAG